MKERLKKFREMLQEHSLKGMLITQPANRQYLSGFTGTSGYLLIGSTEAILVTDSRYSGQAREQSPHFQVIQWQGNLPETLGQLTGECGWDKVGFEKKDVTYSFYQELTGSFPAALEPVDSPAEQLRMVKDPSEIEILQQGAACLDQAYEHILKFIKPGLTEMEISLELEFYLRRLGAEGVSFRFIVASGERGAMPHGVASGKTLAKGELVTMDFGAVFSSYATDMTRTVCLGEPDQRQREVYEKVFEAQEKAASGIKPGMTGKEADALAREVIDQGGYAEYFGHGLGHGVGLETHELPVLSPRSDALLKPGMVVTAEPGIYIPGWGGVRIEDMVLVTESGAQRMTRSSRELISI